MILSENRTPLFEIMRVIDTPGAMR